MIRLVVALGLALTLSTACSTTVEPPRGVPAEPVKPVVTDDVVCSDLDAKGGTFYSVAVIPLMAGDPGRKSVDVDVTAMGYAVGSLTALDGLDAASPDVAREGTQMIRAAEAFRPVASADATALLTSFVGLAVQCQTKGYKPTWFDATALTTG